MPVKEKPDAKTIEEPKAVTTTEPPKSTALATSEYDESDIGAGFEDVTQDELQVPFIVILQKNSPQVEDGNPRQIAGAKAGMLMNTVTNQLYDGKTGISVIVVHRHRNYIEWIPRDDGGGFVATYEADSPEVLAVLKASGRKFAKLKIGDNNDLAETCHLYALLLKPDGGYEHVIIAFASSQIGAYKRLITTAQSIQLMGAGGKMIIPPLFSHVYQLRTEFFTGKNNYTWYKWRSSFLGADAASSRVAKDSDLFEAAKRFREMLKSGRATAAYETMAQEDAPGDDADTPQGYAM